MKNIAILLAGGSGRRLGAKIPKQFLEVAGKTILGHTLERFDSCNVIDELCVVVHSDHLDDAEQVIAATRLSKPCTVLTGGKERYHSSLAAIDHYSSVYGDMADVNLLLHDAVRPLIACETICAVTEVMRDHVAACVAVPSTDTLLQVDADCNIKAIPNRAVMWNAQTPQAFRLDVIADAYRIAMADSKFTTTDDCGVILRYRPDVKIRIVPGLPDNIKVTYAGDIVRLESLLS